MEVSCGKKWVSSPQKRFYRLSEVSTIYHLILMTLYIMLSLNDDDDDAKALPTGVPKDDAMKKGGWGVKMSPKVMASYLYVP